MRHLLLRRIPCPRHGEAFAACDSVPTPWGSFRSLRFRAHAVGKLSQLAIPCPRCGEAFAACNSVPTLWGSFRSLRFRAHTVGKLSQPAIPCPRRGEVFAACDSVPTPWGSFRSYLSWSLEEAHQRLRIVGRFHRPWQISSAYDCKSGVKVCLFLLLQHGQAVRPERPLVVVAAEGGVHAVDGRLPRLAVIYLRGFYRCA